MKIKTTLLFIILFLLFFNNAIASRFYEFESFIDRVVIDLDRIESVYGSHNVLIIVFKSGNRIKITNITMDNFKKLLDNEK